VDTDLTVTEGHAAAERVRRKLITVFDRVQDVLVHVDGEEDHKLLPLYTVSRQDLETIVDPVIAASNVKLEKTRMRIHHVAGTNVVELFVRVDPEKTIDETHSLMEDLKHRLKSAPEIDDIQIFVDIN